MTPIPKKKPLRSKEYMAYVRSLPCCLCDDSVSRKEPHHVETAGTGLKTDDFKTISVCGYPKTCHDIADAERNSLWQYRAALETLCDWLRAQEAF